jgi:hypothetical protein
MEDRLDYIRRMMKNKRLYYSSYNPRAAYMYDLEDAEDDMLWLVAEVERLRAAVQKGTPGS